MNDIAQAMTARLQGATAFPALSQAYLELHGILPLCIESGQVIVASGRRTHDVHVRDDLRLWLGYEPDFVEADEGQVREGIRRLYGGQAVTAELLAAGLREADRNQALSEMPLDDLRSQANEAPVVRLVNLLVVEALEARASDVHLESTERGINVRYRIDGVLQPATAPPEHLAAAILSRLKIMAELDIAERRTSQDGRIRLRMTDRAVDVRVSVLPTHHGESIVLRLLDKNRRQHVALNSIGLRADTLADFRNALARPSGLVLVVLGAPISTVLRLVMAKGLMLAIIGAIIGIAATFAFGRVLDSMVFGAIKPTDAMSLITVLVITAGSVTVASMIPARRALRVSPTIALKAE